MTSPRRAADPLRLPPPALQSIRDPSPPILAPSCNWRRAGPDRCPAGPSSISAQLRASARGGRPARRSRRWVRLGSGLASKVRFGSCPPRLPRRCGPTHGPPSVRSPTSLSASRSTSRSSAMSSTAGLRRPPRWVSTWSARARRRRWCSTHTARTSAARSASSRAAPDRFLCPCHGGSFDEAGYPLDGAAPHVALESSTRRRVEAGEVLIMFHQLLVPGR